MKIKLKPNYIYLMSDGTTGHFKDTTFGGGTKKPVGVVADPTARVAIALKDAGGGTEYEWFAPRYSPHADNTTLYSSNETAATDMEGYKWTWETAGTTDGTIKANQQTGFPAFYAAGHYDPDVTVSGTLVGKKWYLAGWGEWVKGIMYLDFNNNDTSPIYGVLLNESFTKVGGTKIINANIDFLVSTQTDRVSTTPRSMEHSIRFKNTGGGAAGSNVGISAIVRPFIKY